MRITKTDVAWNIAATGLRMTAGVLVIPLMVKILPAEDVGIWTIFLSVSALTFLFDFGFGQTFTRNVTYIFSGAKELKAKGFIVVDENSTLDFSLLKSVIEGMQWLYLRLSIIVFFILATIGTLYLNSVLTTYHGNNKIVLLNWFIFIFIVSYQLYTLYYDSLLQGRGLIKKSKQIIIISQLVFILFSIAALLSGGGLLSLVLAQGVSLLVSRILSRNAFFDTNLVSNLKKAGKKPGKEILKNMLPNSVKIGTTSLCGYVVTRSSIIIGSLFLPLHVIASFGITKSLIDALASVSLAWYSTYYPQIVNQRLTNNILQLKQTYIKSKLMLIFTFVTGAVFLLLFGEPAMDLIKSSTPILSNPLLALMLFTALLENNHGMDGGILLSKNEVPFFRAAIFSGVATLCLLFIFLYLRFHVLALILAPGIAQAIYQNWKWPAVVAREFQLSFADFIDTFKAIYFSLIHLLRTRLKNKIITW